MMLRLLFVLSAAGSLCLAKPSIRSSLSSAAAHAHANAADMPLELPVLPDLPFKGNDNSWCFKGVYDYDNCPEKRSLHECVRCCSDLATYYDNPPSKNVCLATCADKFPKLGIEWTYL